MESDDSDIELLSTQFVRPRAASSSQPVESSSSSRSSSSRKDKPKKTSAAATVSSSQKEVLEMLSDTDDAFEMPSSSSAPAPTAGKSKPQRKLVKKVASSTAATYSNNQKPSTSTSSSALKKNIGGEYSSNSSKRVASTTAAVDIEDDTTSVNPGSKIKPTGRVVNKSRSNNNIINNNKNIDGIEDDDIEDDDGDDVDEQVVGVRQKKMKVMEQQRIARPPRGQDSSSLMKHILNPTPGVINYTALSNHPVIAAPAAENDDSSSNVKGSGRPESIAACDGDKIDQTVEATRSTTMTPFMTKSTSKTIVVNLVIGKENRKVVSSTSAAASSSCASNTTTTTNRSSNPRRDNVSNSNSDGQLPQLSSTSFNRQSATTTTNPTPRRDVHRRHQDQQQRLTTDQENGADASGDIELFGKSLIYNIVDSQNPFLALRSSKSNPSPLLDSAHFLQSVQHFSQELNRVRVEEKETFQGALAIVRREFTAGIQKFRSRLLSELEAKVEMVRQQVASANAKALDAIETRCIAVCSHETDTTSQLVTETLTEISNMESDGMQRQLLALNTASNRVDQLVRGRAVESERTQEAFGRISDNLTGVCDRITMAERWMKEQTRSMELVENSLVQFVKQDEEERGVVVGAADEEISRHQQPQHQQQHLHSPSSAFNVSLKRKYSDEAEEEEEEEEEEEDQLFEADSSWIGSIYKRVCRMMS